MFRVQFVQFVHEVDFPGLAEIFHHVAVVHCIHHYISATHEQVRVCLYPAECLSEHVYVSERTGLYDALFGQLLKHDIWRLLVTSSLQAPPSPTEPQAPCLRCLVISPVISGDCQSLGLMILPSDSRRRNLPVSGSRLSILAL